MNDLAVVLRRYGFLGINLDGSAATDRFDAAFLEPGVELPRTPVSLVVADAAAGLSGLTAIREPAGEFLYDVRPYRILPRRRQYRALLDHVGFSGAGLTPIWTTASGRTAIGWWNHGGRRHLLVGLNVVEELVRYTQGDPSKVATATDKTLWGVGHERPAYLFEDNIVRGSEMVPWADRLGSLVAQTLSVATGLPLLASLPGGAKGAVLLTGDDDQADLAKYQTQRQLLDGFPITYMLLPHTKHSRETLAAMPPSVEYGVHVDALDDPDHYNGICASQTEAVRQLVGRPVYAVRNHGHLNQGYWTQLEAWERSGLRLDFHVRGLDGTCPTGSYLPFRVRRPDRSWSDHWSLFSTFSDSMLFLQKWPEAKQISCIRSLAQSITASWPGVIVANFHPQNVDEIPSVHRAVKTIGEQAGWIALGAESYGRWLVAIDGLRMTSIGRGVRLASDRVVDGVALQWPGQPGPTPVRSFSGEVDVVNPHGPS